MRLCGCSDPVLVQLCQERFPVQCVVGSEMVVEVLVVAQGCAGVPAGEVALVGAPARGSWTQVGACAAAVELGALGWARPGAVCVLGRLSRTRPGPRCRRRLDGVPRRRQLLAPGLQAAPWVVRGGPGGPPRAQLLAHGPGSLDRLARLSSVRAGQVIALDPFAGWGGLPGRLPALRGPRCELARFRRPGAPEAAGTGRASAPSPARGQEPPAGRCRQRGSCARQQNLEALFAPARRARAHPPPGPFLGAAPALGGSAAGAAALGGQSLHSRGLGARRPAGIRGAREASGLQRRRLTAAFGAQLPGGLARAKALEGSLRRGVVEANTARRAAAQRVNRPGAAAFWL